MPTAETLLIFRIAGIACAVPAESVGSIVMPPAHLTHPPGSGRSTPGIFHHAESTYSVIDLHARFGIDTPRKGTGRLLLQDEGLRHFAFLVDEVVGLVRSEEGQWANLPPYLPHSVFWSGFLYRKEIVLCTELSALRTMHDAAPLRRHIEAMQQQAQPPSAGEPTEEKTAAAKPVEPLAHAEQKKPEPHKQRSAAPARDGDKPGTTAPRQPLSHNLKSTPKTAAKPGSTTAPVSGKPGPAARPTAAPKPASRAVARPARATTTSRAAAGGHKSTWQKTAPARPASPAPAIEQHSPIEPDAAQQPRSESSHFALVLILLLLVLTLPAAWWFWPQPQTAPPSPVRIAAVPATPPISRPEPAPPIEPEAPEAEPPVPAPPPPPPPATIDEPRAAAMPLTIERDEAGTINLIIDRQAIAGSAPPPALPLAEPGAERPATDNDSAAELPDNEAPTSAAAPARENSGSDALTKPSVEEEAPLQPGPDWPKPATPTGLEPCDCTHIVVPGDTLWDIAEQYTGNAFNYHDLARRSGIRNPDRIYPGDTVRIIIR